VNENGVSGPSGWPIKRPTVAPQQSTRKFESYVAKALKSVDIEPSLPLEIGETYPRYNTFDAKFSMRMLQIAPCGKKIEKTNLQIYSYN